MLELFPAKTIIPNAINEAHPSRLKVSFSFKKKAASKTDIGMEACLTALTAAASAPSLNATNIK